MIEFYRVVKCNVEGGEISNPEDFLSYEEAKKYASKLELTPKMGECVEIYKMRDIADSIEFVDVM